MNRHTASQALRFVLVSGSGTVINLMTFSLLRRMSVPAGICSVAAFAVACEYNFTLHARVTFQVGQRTAGWFSWRFFVLSSATLGVNLLVLYAAQRAGLPALVAQLAGIAVGFPINFAGSRLWVFQRLGA